MAESLGQLKCQALIFFHAFTGSDTTSAFKGIGKKKAYEALQVCSSAIDTFANFHLNPLQELSEEDPKFEVIQSFTVVMYSKTSTISTVNEARLKLYFERSQDIETIPPTSNSLLLHAKRTIFQSAVWSQCLQANQNLPSPQNFGWVATSDPIVKWQPLWMTQKEASKECREFIKCTCKAEVCSRCKCKVASLKCTLLCTCKCEDKVSFDTSSNEETQ